MARKCLIVLLTAAAITFAADKDRPKFSPGPIDTFQSRQTNDKVTVAARVYVNDEEARDAFGKVNPYKYGILPVLVVVQNNSGQSISLDRMKLELVTADRERVEPTPAADIKYLSGPKRPSMTPGPIPGRTPHVGRNKNALNTWEIEGRAFSARMLPPNETASGFVYFQSPFRPGATLFVNGLRDAQSGKDLFYFELPLETR